MKLSSFSVSNKLFIAYSLIFLIIIFFLFYTFRFYSISGVEQAIVHELETSSELVEEIVESHASATVRSHLKSLVAGTLNVIKYIDEHGAAYNHTQQEREQDAERYINTIKAGNSGYAYVLSSKGVLRIHPYPEIRGTSIIDYDFVKKQVSKRRGYLEYTWQNPDDKTPRNKVLYMDTYEPWDWIITVSAYREDFNTLISVEELKNSIDKIKIRERGYFFVMNLEGDILIHPFLEGKNFKTMQVDNHLDTSFFQEMIDKKNGWISYEWMSPGGEGIYDKMLIYSYLPEYNWIVAASIYKDDYLISQHKSNSVLLIILAVSVILFLIASRKLANMLTRPLKALVQTCEAPIETIQGRDEIRFIAEQIHSYMSALRSETRIREITEEKNRMLAQFPEGNPNPVLRTKHDGLILYANPPARALTEEWECCEDQYLPRDLSALICSFTRDSGSIEYERNGRIFSIMITFYKEQDAYYIFMIDISERKHNEYLMLMSESVFSKTREGISITDSEGKILRVNRAFTEITGYSSEDVIGENPRILKSEHHDQAFYKQMWDSLLSEGSWSGEIWNRKKSGEAYPEWLTINSIYDEYENLIHYVALFRDISDIKASEEQLRYQAYHDSLTGLPNRVLFEDRLTQSILRSDREHNSFAVLFLDMDNFKTINDSLGHSTGDSFLKDISLRLNKTFRGEDTVARLGGDEFVILLHNMNSDRNILDIISRLQAYVNESLYYENHEIIPSVSIGITFFPQDGNTAQGLMKNADMAMYKSKQRGKGTYSFYNQGMNSQFHKRIEMEGRLKKALKNNEFRIAYQPKVSTHGWHIEGFEALIRWNSPDLGMVSPLDFINLAEETGDILEIGDWIFENALADAVEFQKIYSKNLEMAVNLSARQFMDPLLIKRIERILEKSPLDCRLVNLEITENMAMEDSEASLAILENLYNLNVKISIDDFGTGYSSYSYLTRFKTNTLKIDKSFIDGLPGDSKQASVVKNIIDLAHTLNMEVVAEGVEEEPQCLFLRDAGCELIQGYYFSRPLFKEEIKLLLLKYSDTALYLYE